MLSDFHIADNLSIAVNALPKFMVTILSIEEILLPMYVNRSANFSGLSFNQEKIVMLSFRLPIP